MTRLVEIVEVGPRDGLQNEKRLVSTEDKIAFIHKAIEAGVKRLEVTSFVHPKRVPQMADAEDVVRELGVVEGVTRIGLTLNKRGALRALETGVEQLGAVCVASDSFALKNQNQTCAQTVDTSNEIIRLAQFEGHTGQVTIAASFGCPFEGEVPEERVLSMVKKLMESNPVEISLADTIGVGVPSQVSSLVKKVVKIAGATPVRVHFHNTRNTGIANVWAAIEAGATTIDASIGGIGGCPFAPAATGNVATEDVMYMLGRSGIEHGLDMDKIIPTSKWLETILGKDVPSMLAKAGHFPKTQDEI